MYQRQHVYRTEMCQIEDLLIGETEDVNEALIAHGVVKIMQSTAARVCVHARMHSCTVTARACSCGVLCRVHVSLLHVCAVLSHTVTVAVRESRPSRRDRESLYVQGKTR